MVRGRLRAKFPAGRHGFVQTLPTSCKCRWSARGAVAEDAAPFQEEAQELLAYANTEAATQDEQIAQRRIMEIEEELRAYTGGRAEVVRGRANMKSILAEALRRNLEAHGQGHRFHHGWGLSGEEVLYGNEPWDITADVLERIAAASQCVAARKSRASSTRALLANGGPRAGLNSALVLESWAGQLAERRSQAKIDWILNVAKALRAPLRKQPIEVKTMMELAASCCWAWWRTPTTTGVQGGTVVGGFGKRADKGPVEQMVVGLYGWLVLRCAETALKRSPPWWGFGIGPTPWPKGTSRSIGK